MTSPDLDRCTPRPDPLHRGAGAQALPVHRLRGGLSTSLQDWVAEEVPVALEFNGIAHAVMLATPLDLEDFAWGFALGEGIVQAPQELYGCEEEHGELGITLRLQVAASAFMRLKERRRSMAGRTGCGLCGTESLSQVVREQPRLAGGTVFDGRAVGRAMAQLGAHQTLQQLTGAVHAAAWCSAAGDVVWLREDVGRHNALDKLIGALARRGIPAGTGFIAVTSRASFEMVQKAAAAGVALLAAVSAPTALAVHTAARAGMTLVGFARHQDLVVYSHPEGLGRAHAQELRHAS